MLHITFFISYLPIYLTNLTPELSQNGRFVLPKIESEKNLQQMKLSTHHFSGCSKVCLKCSTF